MLCLDPVLKFEVKLMFFATPDHLIRLPFHEPEIKFDVIPTPMT